MGYYRNGGGSVTLKPGTAQAALDHLKATMLDPDYLVKTARGGRSPKSKDVLADHWYSWTDSKRLLAAKTLEEFMGQFFEDLTIDENGVIEFSDSNKIGQEDVLFKHLAPFLQDAEQFAEWHGEDDTHWAWSIRNGVLVEMNGTIVYGEG